jgi:hypothetical protein
VHLAPLGAPDPTPTIVISILSRYENVFELFMRVPGVAFDERNVDTEDTLGFTEYIFDPFLSILNVTLEDAEFAFNVKSGGISLETVNENGALKVSLVPVVSVVDSSDSAPPRTTG